MQTEESEMMQIRWPPGWRTMIDEARGEQSVAEFVRGCVAEKIGKRKMPPSRGRGRPRKIEIDEEK